MTYNVEFSKKATKQLDALPKSIQNRILPKIQSLAEEPLPSGALKLKGSDNEYRIRMGDYRVIYSIEADRLLILILRLGHRRDIYRK